MNNNKRYREPSNLLISDSSLSSGGEEIMGFPSAGESEDERSYNRAKTPFQGADNASESENQSDMDIELANLRLQPDLYRDKVATPRAIRSSSASVTSPFSKTTAPLRVGSEETIQSEHSFVPEDGLDAKHYIKSNEKLSELADLDETGDFKKGQSRNLKKPRAMSMKSDDDDFQPTKRVRNIKTDPEFLKTRQTYYSDREKSEEVYIISSIVQEIASLNVLLNNNKNIDFRMGNELFDNLKINLVDNYAFLYHNEREYLNSVEQTLREFVINHSETEYASKARDILDTFFRSDSKEPSTLIGGKKHRKNTKKKTKKHRTTKKIYIGRKRKTNKSKKSKKNRSVRSKSKRLHKTKKT